MSTPKKDVAGPKPTRRDKELVRDLAVLVQDAAARHRQSAGLKPIGDSQSQRHVAGASVTPVSVLDGWKNVLTGLGTRGDRTMHNQVEWDLSLQEQEAEDLYAGDLSARRAVDLLPHEGTREGIQWEDEKKSVYLAEEHKRLNIMPITRDASIFARLYGGGAWLLMDGVTPVDRLQEPWRKGSQVQSVVVLTRWELWAYATELQRDITKPGFGLPERYRLFPRMTFGQTAITVHSSRIIRFDGRLLPRLAFIKNNFWHDSILTSMRESLGDYKMSFKAVSNVLLDFRMLVHKIAGLSDALNAGNDQYVKQRFEIMNLARSVLGAWVIDAEDDSQFHSASLAGVAELADLVKKRLQAETDTPHTVFFNEAPGGARSMGSSGDHEERNWYDSVHAWQMNYIGPKLEQLNQILLEQPGGPGGQAVDHPYVWKSLWQQDDKEAAETNYANAQADDLNLANALRTPEAIQQERWPKEAREKPASADFVEPEPEPAPNAPKPAPQA